MDYLMSKYNEPNSLYPNAEKDKYIIARHASATVINTQKHIDTVLTQIKKHIASANSNSKKYQIQGYYSYKKISAELTALNIKHELIIGNLQMSALESIIGGHYFCCYECNTPVSYHNKYVPVMYVKIIK